MIIRGGTALEVREFNDQVRRLMRSINLNMIQLINSHCQPRGISHSQAMVLIMLRKFQPMKVSELGEKLNMPNSNISTICARLQKSGLLTRMRDDKDQRTVYLKLTEEADRLTDELRSNLEKEQALLSQRTCEEDRKIIIDGLQRLLKVFEVKEG